MSYLAYYYYYLIRRFTIQKKFKIKRFQVHVQAFISVLKISPNIFLLLIIAGVFNALKLRICNKLRIKAFLYLNTRCDDLIPLKNIRLELYISGDCHL